MLLVCFALAFPRDFLSPRLIYSAGTKPTVIHHNSVTIALLSNDRLPVLDQMLRRAPRKRLDRECWIARAVNAHNRSSQNAQVRSFVREALLVHHVSFGII